MTKTQKRRQQHNNDNNSNDNNSDDNSSSDNNNDNNNKLLITMAATMPYNDLMLCANHQEEFVQRLRHQLEIESLPAYK